MSKREHIGIFGGTFDPIHNTHCEIARAAILHAHLDRVFFVVSARPPHKLEPSGDAPSASPEDRYAMVQAALAGERRMTASRIELDRQGPSYTVDTLRAFRDEYPGAQLFLIVGQDALRDLPKWRDPRGILSLTRLLVVPRPGMTSDIDALLEGHYDWLPFSETPLSSSEIREHIAAGVPFGHLVPAAVEALIREKGIYRAHRSDSMR